MFKLTTCSIVSIVNFHHVNDGWGQRVFSKEKKESFFSRYLEEIHLVRATKE